MSSVARLYSGLLGWLIAHQESGTTIVEASEGSIYIVFQGSTEYKAPVWPPVDEEQRPMMHIDFQVGDLDTAVDEAVALGTVVAGHHHKTTFVFFSTRPDILSISAVTTAERDALIDA